jgi:hypothetical protein
MTLKPVVCYRCDRCKRIYETEPVKCICDRIVYLEGEKVGSFIVIEQSKEDKKEFTVRCLLCGSLTDVHYTNIKDQKSCGCKPKYIELISVSEKVIIYRCKKCGKVQTPKPPIVTYCCEEDDDASDIE